MDQTAQEVTAAARVLLACGLISEHVAAGLLSDYDVVDSTYEGLVA